MKNISDKSDFMLTDRSVDLFKLISNVNKETYKIRTFLKTSDQPIRDFLLDVGNHYLFLHKLYYKDGSLKDIKMSNYYKILPNYVPESCFYLLTQKIKKDKILSISSNPSLEDWFLDRYGKIKDMRLFDMYIWSKIPSISRLLWLLITDFIKIHFFIVPYHKKFEKVKPKFVLEYFEKCDVIDKNHHSFTECIREIIGGNYTIK